MRPSFSVILPVYNRAATVAEALVSVLEQTRPAEEIIVVDDGSDDDLEAALAPFRDRIRLIRQENGGVARARNRAAAEARGDWLAFQDSDDVWDRDHLAVAARDLADAGDEVLCHLGDVTYTGSGYRQGLWAIKGLEFPRNRARRIDDPLGLVVSGMTLQAAAIRRDTFHRLGGFDEDMLMLSDTAFFCRLALEGSFMATGHPMCEIRRAEDDRVAITAMRRTKRLYAQQMAVRILAPLADRSLTPAQKRLVMPRLSGARFALARILAETDPAGARTELWRAAREHPSPFRGWGKAAVAGAFGARGYAWMTREGRTLDRS